MCDRCPRLSDLQVLSSTVVVNRPKTGTQGPLKIAENLVGDASGCIIMQVSPFQPRERLSARRFTPHVPLAAVSASASRRRDPVKPWVVPAAAPRTSHTAPASVRPQTRGAQVEQVQPGKVVKLTGAKVEVFKGVMRLTVDTRKDVGTGSIEEVEDKVKPNKEINMSHIEFDEFIVGPKEGAGEVTEAAKAEKAPEEAKEAATEPTEA